MNSATYNMGDLDVDESLLNRIMTSVDEVKAIVSTTDKCLTELKRTLDEQAIILQEHDEAIHEIQENLHIPAKVAVERRRGEVNININLRD